jgi:hypothetical protein
MGDPELVDMPSARPARKVLGATAGAGIGTVTANLALWALDDLVFEPKVPDSVPEAVNAFVLVVVPIVTAFVGGYFTRRGAGDLRA